jgi:predicted amidophosphoribosyltransferase
MDNLMSLEPKNVNCACGNPLELNREKVWCPKCARPVYYHEKDRRRDKLNRYYLLTVFFVVITFMVYLFIELIAEPLLNS